ncbi:hypothetical protein AJ80_09199 [Polytolypa hystricis UAMH7299]|uniref:Uncharacterized protein n=1 Tax=Polytolypa hystricis (strain UAMH7299) TaxID=1447883 RepID=A0A2B7WUL4_POLH7|nr:hypothetical protein AJ80_09199 [Polytolypa hystricis UAMH7299]
MRALMDDLGLSMSALKATSIFSGDEERFAFARALSRLVEMESVEWVERLVRERERVAGQRTVGGQGEGKEEAVVGSL